GWGSLLNAIVVIGTVWNSLFYLNDPQGYAVAARTLNPMGRNIDPIPAWTAWLVVGSVCAVCLLMINRKIRAHEVVRCQRNRTGSCSAMCRSSTARFWASTRST